MNIIGKIENNISAFLQSCAEGAGLLAGISGGADSMALLSALCALSKQPDFCFQISVLHIEHGIRPAGESCCDADFVLDFCKANGIDGRIERIAPGRIASFARRKGIGIEAAARFFRHKALRSEARRINSQSAAGKTMILLAHTKDDLLETSLMRVLRGAGPAGLSAMKEKRVLIRDRGEAVINIVRPLLTMTRRDVIDYLTAKNISWREDSTNSDEKFLRNRIRRRLIPLLNDSFPEWKAGVASMAETQSLVRDFLADETKSRIKWEKNFSPRINTGNYAVSTGSCAVSTGSFAVSTEEANFFSQPVIIREEAVFYAMNRLSSLDASQAGGEFLSGKTIKRSVVRQFCEGEIKAADLGQMRIRHENGKIILSLMHKEFFECGISLLSNKSIIS